MKSRTVILCCGKKGCPTLTRAPGTDLLTLRDDFGGVVKLKEEELQKISEALIELRDKDGSSGPVGA